jgi:oligopeptide transport system substrate-binding protein
VRSGTRALVAALAVALAASCSSGGTPPAAGPDAGEPGVARASGAPSTLRLAVAGVTTLDPALSNAGSPSQAIVADLLYDGLTAFDASTNTVVGAVAQSWSASADAMTWTFELDPAATFSDGTPIASSDVKATLERVAALGVKSVDGLQLSTIEGYDEFLAAPTSGLSGIETPTSSTVVLRLRSPFSSFDELLTDPAFGIVPAGTSSDQADFAGIPVTSGPFRVTERNPGLITTVRSDGSDAVLGAIVVRVFDDTAQAHESFRNGDVDLSVLAGDEVVDAATDGSLVLSAPQQVSLFYGMNMASPVLSSPALRRAIVKAVDRDGIRRAVFGDSADAMNGLLGPGVTGSRNNACGSACAYDPGEARAIVETAYPDGGVPTVHVDHYEDGSGREAAIAQAIVDDLVAAGIPAEARVTPFDSYGQLLAGGGAELFRFGWIGAYPSAGAYLDALFGSGGSDNVFAVTDGELDGLLAGARAEVDDVQRATIYMSAEDRVLALDAVVPIVRYRAHLVATGRVHDVVLAPNGSFDAERISLS